MTMMPRTKLLGLGLGLLATVFWSSLYSVTRLVFGSFEADPITLSFLRCLLASGFFVGVVLLRGQGQLLAAALRTQFWMFLFLGLTGVFAEGITQFYALRYTTAARCSLFANTSPILTVCLAALCLKERVRKRAVAGLLVGFLAMVLGLSGQPGSDRYMAQSLMLGDLLALLSAVCWSAYTVGGGGVTQRYGGVVSASAAMLLGTGLTLGFLLLTGRPVWLAMPPAVWAGVAYLGIGASGVAYIAWFSALKYLKAGELGAFGYVSTMLATVLAMGLVGERISITFGLAFVGVIAGVALMTAGPAARAPAAPAHGPP